MQGIWWRIIALKSLSNCVLLNSPPKYLIKVFTQKVKLVKDILKTLI